MIFAKLTGARERICDGDYKNNSAYYGTYFGHFEGEPDLLVPLYNNYNTAIDLEDANLPFHLLMQKVLVLKLIASSLIES